jgi:hypothetical protein
MFGFSGQYLTLIDKTIIFFITKDKMETASLLTSKVHGILSEKISHMISITKGKLHAQR